ncbi:MAG: hypothetical protein AVDCRST_MAG40-908, partial [uncultured Gemmatimonadaceae bacterium]
ARTPRAVRHPHGGGRLRVAPVRAGHHPPRVDERRGAGRGARRGPAVHPGRQRAAGLRRRAPALRRHAERPLPARALSGRPGEPGHGRCHAGAGSPRPLPRRRAPAAAALRGAGGAAPGRAADRAAGRAGGHRPRGRLDRRAHRRRPRERDARAAARRRADAAARQPDARHRRARAHPQAVGAAV